MCGETVSNAPPTEQVPANVYTGYRNHLCV
jgi:hypothetical protein